MEMIIVLSLIFSIGLFLLFLFLYKKKKIKIKNLNPNNKNLLNPEKKIDEIDSDIDKIAKKYKIDDSMDEKQYIELCINILKNEGWEIKTKGKSSENVIDFIALKDGISVSVHTDKKLKEVDKNIVLKIYNEYKQYLTKHAVIVTNSSIDKKSVENADSHNISILNEDDLVNLYDKLKNKSYFG